MALYAHSKRVRLSTVASAAFLASILIVHAGAQAAVRNWNATATGTTSTPGNWNPAVTPVAADDARFAAFLDNITNVSVDADHTWTSLEFMSGAPAYTLTGSTAGRSLKLDTGSAIVAALRNNSGSQQIFNVGNIGIRGKIDSGTELGGSLVINGALNVGNGSTDTATSRITLAGSNDIFFNVSPSINSAGNLSGGAWTSALPATGTTMYTSLLGSFYTTDYSGRVYLGDLGSTYRGTFRLEGSGGAKVRLTNNNSLGSVGANSPNNARTGVFIHGGTTGNATLEIGDPNVGNLNLGRFILFMEPRSGAVADVPHFDNISGNNTYSTGSFAWNTIGTASGNWNIKSSSGKLTIVGGEISNTLAAPNVNLQLMGAGDGQIDAAIVQWRDTATYNSVNIVKKDSGKWTLTNIPNLPSPPANNSFGRFDGTTTIEGGTLEFKPATPILLNKAVSVADTATLAITSFDTTNTVVTTSGLTLNGSTTGANVTFNLLGGPTVAPLAIDTLNGFNVVGANKINVLGGPLTVGQFPLISYSGTRGSGTLQLDALPPRVIANLADTGSLIRLDVTDIDTIRWHGGTSAWDIDTTQNWRTVSDNTATTYLQPTAPGDSVTFDDNAVSHFDVNVGTAVNPASITYNSTLHNYSLGGAAVTTGSLLVSGSKDVTINNSNLTVSSAFTQNGSGTTTIANTGTLSLPTSIALTSGTLVIERAGDASMGAVTGSGALQKKGAGTLNLTGNSTTFDGPVEVAGGTLRLSHANGLGTAAANTTVLPGATLDLNAVTVTSGEIITVGGTGAGGVGALYSSSTAAHSVIGSVILTGPTRFGSSTRGYDIGTMGGGNTFTGNGYDLELVMEGPAGEIDLIDLGDTNLGNISVTGGGPLYIGGSTTLGATGTLTLLNAGRLGIFGHSGPFPDPKATTVATFDKPIVVAASALGGQIEVWRGNQTIDAPVTLNGNLSATVYTNQNNTNGTITFSQKITGAGNLAVHLDRGGGTGFATRLGTVVLTSNDNDYAGTTTIGGGGSPLLTGNTVTSANDVITLSVGDGGSAGKLGAGEVINNATLQFNRFSPNLNDPFTVPNVISGAGQITTATSHGDVTLSGNNTYAGLTVLNGGSVTVTGSHTGGAEYRIGGNVGTDSTLTLNSAAGGITQTGATIDFSVGYNGTGHFVLADGDLNVGRTVYVGRNLGSIGTFQQNADKVAAGQDVLIGSTSQGTYEMTGGMMSAGRDLTLGNNDQGIGDLNHESGNITVTRDVSVGWWGKGTYIMDGGTLGANGWIIVGRGETTQHVGIGEFTLNDGVVTANADDNAGGNNAFAIGFEQFSDGTFTMNGGTVNVNQDWFVVGVRGPGHGFQHGGTINSTTFAMSQFATATSDYTMDASVSASQINTTDWMVVGMEGSGTFTLDAGAVNVGTDVIIGQNPGSTGTLNLQGGVLNAAIGSGKLGAGQGFATFSFTGGTLKVKEFNAADFGGNLLDLVQDGAGSLLDVTGNSTVLAQSSVYNLVAGTATIGNGHTLTASGVTNGAGAGVINVGNGPSNPQGDYNLNGTVDAADFVAWRKNPGGFAGNAYDVWRQHFGETSGTGFSGTLDVGGGSVDVDTLNLDNGQVKAANVSPGLLTGTGKITGSLTLGSSSIVHLHLGGTSSGSYDQIDVTSNLSADGTLKVTFSNFTLQQGQSFDIFNFPLNNWSGGFSSFDLPGGQSSWNLTQLSMGGNGTITYTSMTPLSPPGSGSSLEGGAVPEPATLTLLMLAGVALCGRCSRRTARP